LLLLSSFSLSVLCYNSHSFTTHTLRIDPQPIDTIMGPELLCVLRICLVLLAAITFIMSAHQARELQLPLFGPKAWPMWLPLFLSILSVVAYGWTLKASMAQKYTIQSHSARYACSFLLCAAWLVSPSHSVNSTLETLREYGLEDMFSEIWGCGNLGNPLCKLRFGIDICGFLMALLVFLEVTLIYLNERSLNAHKEGTLPTTVVVAPGPVQQFAYNPVQQPGKPPAAYYPQPVMYQTPVMPYQVAPAPKQ
ncbi:MAG: hypothetical protein J3Q66DRAFT_412634, partial [Benniella sp.]